jgi:hypothetical protein
MRNATLGAAILAVAAALTAVPSHSAVVVSKGNTAESIPGLTGFATTGADMDNLKVTAAFSGGLTQTLNWATTGPGSGGVTGTGWSLSVSGDTFSSPWLFTFTNGNGIGRLDTLTLDGSEFGQITVFDTDSPSPGTNGSASGLDFAIGSGCTGCNGVALYQIIIGIDPAPPVGDIFHKLTVSFDAGTGPDTNWSFLQDTDNDIRKEIGFVPEPSSQALVGIALLSLIGARRRRT